MKPTPPILTPLPSLHFPLSKRVKQLRPWRAKLRFRYCLLPKLISLLILPGFFFVFPKQIVGYCFAVLVNAVLYVSYRLLRLRWLAKAEPKFHAIRKQMAQHLLHYKKQVAYFNQERAKHLEQCQQLRILAYQLAQLPAFALKKLRAQQQEAFFSQYPLTAAPFTLAPQLLQQLHQNGIIHAADIAKLRPELIWNPLSYAQYFGLLKWRRCLQQRFVFCHQPLQLARLQKQLRSQIPQEQEQLAAQAEHSLHYLWLHYHGVLQQRKICQAQLLVLRKALKKQGNLICTAKLIK